METTYRQLKTILCADVSEYSKLMETNEQRTHTHLCARLSLIANLIDHYNGVTLRTEGDSVLASFDDATDALQCAIKIQIASAEQNKTLRQQEQLWLRIGINSGNAIIDNGEVFGNCVNIAARLESIAKPGGIVISESVFNFVENLLFYDYTYLGSHRLKNIVTPIKLYRVPLETEKINEYSSFFITHLNKYYLKPSAAIAVSFSFVLFVSLLIQNNQTNITKDNTGYTSSITSSINTKNNKQDVLNIRQKYVLNQKIIQQSKQNEVYLFDQALKLDLSNDDYKLDTKKFILVEDQPSSTEIMPANVFWNY